MNISAKTKICMVIGDPIEHSLSPVMHNAGYEALEINDKFIYIASQVKIADIPTAILGIRSLGILGVSCTMPHKLEVVKYLDEVDPVAKKIGAVNTIVNRNGKLIGYNTDWLGVVTPLEQKTSLNGKKAAIIGAGGAARAITYGLLNKKAKVTIYNRTLENAKTLADKFDCQAKSFSQLSDVIDEDIIINATPIGMHPHISQTPVDKKYLSKKHIVFEAIYHPYITQLLKDAKEKGADVIYGYEMLLYQGTAQFELFTGKKAPVDAMRKPLLKNLNI